MNMHFSLLCVPPTGWLLGSPAAHGYEPLVLPNESDAKLCGPLSPCLSSITCVTPRSYQYHDVSRVVSSSELVAMWATLLKRLGSARAVPPSHTPRATFFAFLASLPSSFWSDELTTVASFEWQMLQ